MGRNIRIDTDALGRAAEKLESQSVDVLGRMNNLNVDALEGYSAVSGFRDAARNLGRISGYESPKGLQVLGDYLRDASHVTDINLKNTMRADGSFAQLFSQIALMDELGYADMMGEFQAKLNLANPTVSHFTSQKPVVGTQTSLIALNHKMMTSRIPSAAIEAADWGVLAGKLIADAARLIRVHHNYASSLETEWVQKGAERITQIQNAAVQFAGRAAQMAGYNTTLGLVTSAEALLTAGATGAYSLILRPSAKKAFEQTYLSFFSPRATAELAFTTPTFTQLLPDLNSMPRHQMAPPEVREPDSPSFERSPLPKMLKGVLEWAGHRDLANATNPYEVVAQYGQPNPDMLSAISSGATATQAASLSAPSMPPTLSPGLPGSAPTAFAGGAPGAGVGGFAPVNGGLAAGSRALGAPAAGAGSFAGAPMVGGAGAGQGGRAGGSTRLGAGGAGLPGHGIGGGGFAGAPMVGGAGGGGSTRVGAGSTGLAGRGMGGAGFAPGGAFGSGARFGGSHPGGAGAGAGSGARLGAGAAGANAHTAGAGNGAGRGGMVAGAPMGGAAGRGQQGEKKNAKVQAVTSAVEREGNLRALLGDSPLVLPSVIGEDTRR